VDDTGAEILLNGQPTGNTNLNLYAAWTPVAITNGFRLGTNTLTFVVANGGGGPSGVRVELNSRAEANCLNQAGLGPTNTVNPWLRDGLRFVATTLENTKAGLTNLPGRGLQWTQVLRVDLPYDCDRADLDLTYLARELVIIGYQDLQGEEALGLAQK
jgi:hypothetical protein